MTINPNISNLQVFNKEGHSLSCSNGLQEVIQTGIAKKVGKLFNAEGFLALIPDFDPTQNTKLRIHLTKDGITIQLLERDLKDSKTASSYAENDPAITAAIKIRKEKIIKKIDSLFKQPSSLDPSTRLESEKIRPLFIPSRPSQGEQIPFKIGFDATVSNPQIQQLHAKIEGLQDQLNKKTPHSEELQIIKEQLQLLSQAIHNLSISQENITYPHTEEYALIDKLVGNQRDVCRALLDLLSKNLNQTPTTPLTPPSAQRIENSALKEMIIKLQQEKTDLEETREGLEGINTTLQNNLRSKDRQITALEQQIQDLPTNEALHQLQSKLETLQNEKVHLQSQQDDFTSQLDELTQSRDDLEIANATLQENLLSKDEKITTLEQQIQGLPTNETFQKLQSKLETLRSDKADLQTQQAALSSQLDEVLRTGDDLNNSNVTLQRNLLSKNEKITTLEQQIQGLPTNEALHQLQSKLETLQNEKVHLQSQQDDFTSQLDGLTQARDDLEIANATLQENLLSKDEKITTLEQQIQGLPTNETFQKLQSKLETLQNEKVHLQSQRDGFTSQLDELTQSRDDLEIANAALQENLLSKDEQIIILKQQIQNLPTDEALLQLQSELEILQSEKINLQSQISAKDEEICELNKEAQHLSEVHQALQNQLRDEKEISNILETAAIPAMGSELDSIDATIEKARDTMEEELSSLENSTILEGLLTPSGYYTLTATPSLEESLETSSEITILQAKINSLEEELEDIRPIAYNTTNKIEKMEKSTKALALELSEKTKTIEDLEEEKNFLESQLDRSESQLKKLQTAQYMLKEQQKEISVSSEENNDLLEELEKIHEQLSSEKKERAELEQTHEDQLERLRTLYDENALEKMERINAKILNLQQEQKNICFTLAEAIAKHVNSGSVTEDIGKNIFELIEKAFNTTGYKTLLDLVSSEEEDLLSTEESVSSDEYDEDSYMI